VSWVVIDDNFVLHTEANAYLGGLRARDCSINTEWVYAPDSGFTDRRQSLDDAVYV
jgi:hypothetical protein